jgi:hypothetical protein
MIKLFGAKLKCPNYLEVYLVALISFYSKLSGCIIEGRKYAAAAGR